MMLKWYVNRLKTMSALEIPYRIRQLVQKKIEQKRVAGKIAYRISFKTTSKVLASNANFEQINLLPPVVSVFGKILNFNEQKIDWHQDVFSLERYPLTFSKSISIRDNPLLSAKNVWEINRLQFLPQLAFNFSKTQDRSYLNQFQLLCTSWIDENPFLQGVNWYSNIEVNIRLINWAVAWDLLDVDLLVTKDLDFKRFVEEKWLPSIYDHCKYSYTNPSKFSSANNHLISEYSGLFVAASKWEFKESEKWLRFSKDGLEREIVKQHSNGINKEEAAEYIQFITDFFLVPYVIGENKGNHFSADYLNSLKEIFEYIYEFTDVSTNFPQYGDEDDGKVICFSTDKHYNNFKSLMTSAAILFGDSRFKSKSAGFDLKNELLFGEKGKIIFSKIPTIQSEQFSKFYKLEGHFIFRKQKREKEIYLHFDAAPLGYLSIAAHGHADALSFLMHVNGFPVFVDSGTYSYHVSKQWREYFVSTMAHNTVCVDVENQATQAGDTMWLNHYQCTVLGMQQNCKVEIVKATHTGYKNVSHTRTIEFIKEEDTFLITDEIKNNDGKMHDINVLFHLHPDITLTDLNDKKILLLHPSGIKLSLELDSIEGDLKILKGQEEPILGWYSQSFMQKEPTTVISYNKKTKSSIKVITKIRVYEY